MRPARVFSVRVGFGSLAAASLVSAFAVALAGGCGDSGSRFQLGAEASLDIDPISIVFGDVPRGGEARRNVTIRHTGTSGVIQLDPIRLETSSLDLSIGLIEQESIGPGEEVRIQIVYASAHDEPDSATLVIGHNLAGRPETRIPVLTPGQRGRLIAQPGILDFGIVQAGAPKTMNVTVLNGGTAPATLVGFENEDSQDFQVNVPAGTVIEPNGSAVVQVTYAPTGRDKDLALITLTSDREDVEVQLQAKGEEETPILIVDPSLIQLGWTRPFEVSARDVTVRNDGNTGLVIESIGLADAPSTVGLISLPATPFTLLPGAAKTFGVIFAPVELVPMRVDPLAKLHIVSSDAARSPLDVPIFGAAGEPSIVVVPKDVVDFAYVAQGYKARREVVVINEGSDPVAVTAAELVDPQTAEFAFPDAGKLPVTLNPGETVELELTFENQGAADGTVYARFFLHTTDPVVPVYPLDVVARRAQRPTCEAAFVPDLLAVGAYRPGEKGEGVLTVVNYGSGECEYRDYDFDGCIGDNFGIGVHYVCDNSVSFNPFELVDLPAPSTKIGPGESLDFRVRVTAPTVTSAFGRDAFYARLLVILFDPNASALEFVTPPGGINAGVNVRAESAVPLVTIRPPEIAFGQVRTDCTSDIQQVQVYANGPVDATITSLTVEGCADSVIVDGPALPAKVPGFGSVYVNVRYAPAAPVPADCRLVIENDSQNDPHGSVALSGGGTDVTHKVDLFKQVPPPKVDVLFIVDDSGSMGDDQERLKQVLPKLVAIATTWGQDYHMAVTTTDTKLVQGQFKGLPRWVDDTVDPAVFAQNLVVGTAGHYIERGLAATDMALYARNERTDIACLNQPNQCPADDGFGIPLVCTAGFCSGRNYGFLRDDAELVVIIVSDEEDSSDESVAYYIDRFANVKKQGAGVGVTVHGIIAPPAGCLGGFGTPGHRYVETVEAFRGVYVSICAPDFDKAFADIGAHTFGLKDRFYPSLDPDPTSIQVTVDGAVCNAGWSWNAATKAVIFEEGGGCYPQFDEEIRIEYDVYCAAPRD